MQALPLRQRSEQRLTAMETERASWMAHWGEINRVLLPRSGKLFSTEPNKGDRRNQDILDNTSIRALTTLEAGMQSGLTSPARPWVKLETDDPGLMEVAAVSSWLDQVTVKMLNVFARSNTYPSLKHVYRELGAYGTAGDVILPSFKNVIHHYPLTAGEFVLGLNDEAVVDTLGRRLQMTVGQIYLQFVRRPDGTENWANVSPLIKNMWDSNQLDQWIKVCHMIEPRRDRDSANPLAQNMAFSSIYFEEGGNSDRLLRESGFRRFPALAPRWSVAATGDVYGSDCPGMVALGDIQQLQLEQLRKSQGIDYMTNPPLQVPSTLKNQDSDWLPGGITYVDMTGPQNAVRTAFDVQINLQHLGEDINDVRRRIDGAFYADVFLFLSNLQGMSRERTAREIAEIHEEKLLMLGPVVENLQTQLLQPLIDITFDALMAAGALPPAPPELEGKELKVEFTSILAQAQRSVSMAGVDRFIGAVASIAAAKQDQTVWDKVDTDKVIDKAAGYIGIDPELVRGMDDVLALRDQRAQAQKAAAAAEAAQHASETAKNLASADTSGNNALTQVMQGFAQ